jgi:hypothetical protein
MTAAQVTVPEQFRIEQRHIGEGQAADCFRCPGALAITEGWEAANPGVRVAVALSPEEAYVSLHGEGLPEWLEYTTVPGEDLTAFIDRVDSFKRVEPMEFTLRWRQVATP